MSTSRVRVGCVIAGIAAITVVGGASSAAGSTAGKSKVSITQRTLPPGTGPSSIVTGPDGDLWFTEATTKQIVRSTPAGAGIEFKDPGLTVGGTNEGAGTPGHIARGPDGDLWFTAQTPDYIGRVTPAGQISDFALSGVGTATLNGITAGPDGDVWFTTNSAVGRVTPAGVISLFPVPGHLIPQGITEGGDGDLWFAAGKATAKSNGYVVRMTPGGSFRPFKIAIAGTSPTALTLGPGKAIWFAESGRIGRITQLGTITQFRLPKGQQRTLGGIAAAGGDLWVTSTSTNAIIRMTPAGAFYPFTVPSPGKAPTAITVGPGASNLWFTEPSADRIGRVLYGG